MDSLKYQKYISALVASLILLISLSYATQPYSSYNTAVPSIDAANQFARLVRFPYSNNSTSPKAPAGVISYVSVDVDNTQNVPTPVPFDLEVKMGSYFLRSYESPTLGNVIWFSLNGTIIPSWIQCNANSSSNCTLYWLKLDFSIPGNFTTTIFMGFDNRSISNFANSDSLQGEAPQISQVYGEYDNGHLIFPFYCNFAGSTLPSGWKCYHNYTANTNVNNGLVIQDSFNDAFAYAVYARPINQSMIIESFITQATVTSGYPTTQAIGLSTTLNLTNHLVYAGTPYDYYFENSFEADLFHTSGQQNEYTPNANSTQVSPTFNFTGNSYTVGIYWNKSLQYWYLNGNTIYVSHNSSVEYGAYYPSAGMASGGNGAGILKIQYIRGRYLPPDNVMPEITGEYVVSDFGCVTFTASGIPSQATWYLNISNYPVLEHSGTLSSCVQLPAGYYYYNVSSYYQGSKFAAAGTFAVSGNAKTYVLIVFVQRIANLPPHRNSILLPPEIYLIIFEILILITGFALILTSKRRSNSD